jgi:hypothetical protein
MTLEMVIPRPASLLDVEKRHPTGPHPRATTGSTPHPSYDMQSPRPFAIKRLLFLFFHPPTTTEKAKAGGHAVCPGRAFLSRSPSLFLETVSVHGGQLITKATPYLLFVVCIEVFFLLRGSFFLFLPSLQDRVVSCPVTYPTVWP